jgi:hypothetical protein
VSEQRFKVYHGMDENLADEIATLVFDDGALVHSESVVPAWWTKPKEDFGQKFAYDIAHRLTLEQFQKGHPSLVMVPEGGTS